MFRFVLIALDLLLSSLVDQDDLYRKFLARGVYLHEREILLGPRSGPTGNVGYFVITPFQCDNGYAVAIYNQRYRFKFIFRDVILVNRGWIARDMKNQKNRSSEALVHPLYNNTYKVGCRTRIP